MRPFSHHANRVPSVGVLAGLGKSVTVLAGLGKSVTVLGFRSMVISEILRAV